MDKLSRLSTKPGGKRFPLKPKNFNRHVLESEGIESFLKSDNAGGALSYLTTTTGIEIIVRKEDAERAYTVIQKRNS